MPNPPAWRVPPGSRFRWRHWDDEYVLYHEESGDTHCLQPLGARALQILDDTPLPTDDLTERLATEFGLSREPGLPDAIAQMLADFRDLGMIEPLDDSRDAESRCAR